MFCFRLLVFSFYVSLLVSLWSCSHGENNTNTQPAPAENIAIPTAIQAAELPAGGALSVKIFIDGSTTPAATNSDVDETATSINITFTAPAGTHSFTILFEYEDLTWGGPFEIATATKSLDVGAGTTQDLVYLDTDYTYADDDSDGLSNLNELDSTMGTDPADATCAFDKSVFGDTSQAGCTFG